MPRAKERPFPEAIPRRAACRRRVDPLAPLIARSAPPSPTLKAIESRPRYVRRLRDVRRFFETGDPQRLHEALRKHGPAVLYFVGVWEHLDTWWDLQLEALAEEEQDNRSVWTSPAVVTAREGLQSISKALLLPRKRGRRRKRGPQAAIKRRYKKWHPDFREWRKEHPFKPYFTPEDRKSVV